MAEEDGLAVVAPAPAEFNRNLRCCVTCRLVKTLDQFYEQGCENCPFLDMVEDRERIDDCTTTEFQGMVAVIDPEKSWAAKWTHHKKHVPGCYALAVQSDLPQHITEILESNGIQPIQDD